MRIKKATKNIYPHLLEIDYAVTYGIRNVEGPNKQMFFLKKMRKIRKRFT